jgi:O-antigen/teichoic acid export membrane protein
MAQQTLASRVVNGLLWKVGSEAFGQIWRLAVTLVLVHLLTPRDYGLAAMVLVFSMLVPIFSDLALGAALVQRKELTEDERSTVFWTSTGVGLLCTVVGIACSWPLAAFYGEPEVQPLFAVMSLSFLISAIGTTQGALLTRAMAFRSLELRWIAAAFAAGVTGITLAATGFGPWSIVAQQVVIAATSTVLLWTFSSWRPSFRFSVESLRSLAGFSANVFGTRILFFFNRNSDNLIVGRYLGASALGIYSVAYNVMLAPLNKLAWPIQSVMFPAFAQVQDDRERMATMWMRVNRMVGAVTIPAMAGLVIVAPEFVRVVLGDRWSAAIPVVQVLAWVGLLQSLQSLNSSILQALDRTRTLLLYAVVALVASLAAFVGGLAWGVVGVAAAYALVSTFVEPYYTWLTARALGASPFVLVRALAGVAVATGGMMAAVVATRLALVDRGASDVAVLVTCVAVGIVVYAALVALRAPELASELRSLRRRGRESEPDVAVAQQAT